MYEHYEPADRVFVNREAYLEWMRDALERCRDKSVVLHLRGIGGIGKSSLLAKWGKEVSESVQIDFEQHQDYWSRLDVVSRAAVRLGVRLRRFDFLWHIRKRFVEGVEPAAESGREWAKEVLAAIPFVGSIAAIGGAISAVGKKVAPKIRERYGDIGSWLSSRLGEDYMSRLLEVLWKEPRHAEFLYMDALLEDLNQRKSDKSLLFLFDQFEIADAEKPKWMYKGKRITEAELWYAFLASLQNCVGVLASRFEAPKQIADSIESEELLELDRNSCRELLRLRNVESEILSSKIVNVSGGNPFVIDAICDIMEAEELSGSEIDELRAETLEEVRLKTWRRLFGEAEGLHDFINRAGLLPFFNRRLLGIVAPKLTSDYWDRITRLSFVRGRDDGTFVLHDLAKNLVLTELGEGVRALAREIVTLLESAYASEPDPSLLSHAISVEFLADEDRGIGRLFEVFNLVQFRRDLTPLVTGPLRLDSPRGNIVYAYALGWTYLIEERVAESEHVLREALALAQDLVAEKGSSQAVFVALACSGLALLLTRTGRHKEGERFYDEAIASCEGIDPHSRVLRFDKSIRWASLRGHGMLMWSQYRLREAENSCEAALVRAIELSDMLDEDSTAPETLKLQASEYVEHSKGNLSIIRLMLGKPSEAESLVRDILDSSLSVDMKAGARGVLGEALRLTGRAQEAEVQYKACLDSMLKAREENPDVPWCASIALSNYASVLFALREYDRAEKVYRQSLEEVRPFNEATPEIYGKILLWTLSDYSTILALLGRADEALDLSLEALQLSEAISHRIPDFPSYKKAALLCNRGVILRLGGQLDSAERSFQEAVEMTQEEAEKHPETLMVSDLLGSLHNNLGLLRIQTENLSDAEKHLRRAHDIKRRLAETCPQMFNNEYASTASNLGILLCRLGRLEESEQHLQAAVASRRQLADQSPVEFAYGLVNSLNNLSGMLLRSGRSDEAWETILEAARLAERSLTGELLPEKKTIGALLVNAKRMASDVEKRKQEYGEIREHFSDIGLSEFDTDFCWLEEDQVVINPTGP